MTLLRLERLEQRLRRFTQRALGLNRTVYVNDRVDEYRSYWQAAAALLGAEFRAITNGIWVVDLHGVQIRLAGHVVPVDDPVTLRVAGDKELGYRFAADARVPVPAYQAFTLDRLHLAKAFWQRHGPPTVIKPQRGTSSGLGVTTHVTSWRGVRRAAALASLFDDCIVIERMVPAESCRLLFLDGELLHAVRRRGVDVTGDGAATIAELMMRAGIVSDDTARLTLGAQKLALSAVPATGQRVVVRCLPRGVAGSSELRTIYDETITAQLSPVLIEEARRIVARLGARFAGVDILTNDPTRSLAESGGVFLEINTTPGIHHHYQTDLERQTHPVAVAILRRLLDVPATSWEANRTMDTAKTRRA